MHASHQPQGATFRDLNLTSLASNYLITVQLRTSYFHRLQFSYEYPRLNLLRKLHVEPDHRYVYWPCASSGALVMGTRLEENSKRVRKRIEEHTFDNEQGEEYEASKFGGFPEYFRRKKIKLQNRDAERRAQSSNKPAIFRGVVAHVNGYTQPSLNDLHDLIVEHGGGFMQYLDGKTTVTHIIASNLTPKKKVEFRAYRIVKPAWVVDSIKAGKLLPWDAYRVVNEGPGQQIIGLSNTGIESQLNVSRPGYRDQTDTSWYTSQVKDVAKSLDRHDGTHSQGGHYSDAITTDTGLLTNASSGSTILLTPPEPSQPRNSEQVDPLSEKGTIRDVGNVAAMQEANIGAEGPPFTVGDDAPLPESRAFNAVLPAQDENDACLSDDELLAELDALSEAEQRAMTAEEHNALLLSDPRVRKSTVVNPQFLKQYYEESRLHHLSTWKADLKSKLQALAAEKTSSQKAKQKRPPGSRRYILHVDFDSFFAAVSLKKYPQYIDKPVVVAHGGGSGSEIASCNYPARKFGIKNGMWMKNAQKMCSDLKVLPYDFKAYEDASRAFYEVIMDTGGIVQSISVDEALVDVSLACTSAGGHEGIGVHEGSVWREQAMANEIARNIRDAVQARTGCAVSVGIGGSILLAKVALRKAKPAGQHQIKPEDALDFLADLTVQELPGVAYSIGGKLEEIGVKYIKDIRELSRGRLISVLGPKTGEKIWDYARGMDRTEVGEQVIRKSVSAEVNWGIRFVTQEQADEFVSSLCEELHKRLLMEKVKGKQLTMKLMRKAADAPLDPPKHLGHGKCDTFNKSVVLGNATNDEKILSREAISIMKGWHFPPGELRGIGVQMTKLEPLKGTTDEPQASSQKRLHFRMPQARSSEAAVDDDIETTVTPRKPKATPTHPAAAFASEDSPSGSRRPPLNILGTQFVLTTQVDPEVLAELPPDIRSKFAPVPHVPQETPGGSPTPLKSPSIHPASPPFPSTLSNSPAILPDSVPSHSQLDPEAIEALPPDVRAEVLAFYQTSNSPRKARAQALLPQSPRKSRTIPASKKQITPTRGRKRIGLLSKSRPTTAGAGALSTLTQSNFVASRPGASGNGSGISDPFTTSESLDPEFLAALPSDIRAEVLAQARRERLQKRGGIIPSVSRKVRPPTGAATSGQRRIRLPPKPPAVTFTNQGLCDLPELREALGVWYEEFKHEGPFEEDVTALAGYLHRVVCEEKDMSKAVGVGKWLAWVIDEDEDDAGDADPTDEQGQGRDKWRHALDQVRQALKDAMQERGLGAVEI